MPDTVANPTRRDNVADAAAATAQNCPWCGEGTWNGRRCLTCGATSEIGQQTRQIARAAVRRFRLEQAVTPVRVLTLVLDESREVTR